MASGWLPLGSWIWATDLPAPTFLPLYDISYAGDKNQLIFKSHRHFLIAVDLRGMAAGTLLDCRQQLSRRKGEIDATRPLSVDLHLDDILVVPRFRLHLQTVTACS